MKQNIFKIFSALSFISLVVGTNLLKAVESDASGVHHPKRVGKVIDKILSSKNYEKRLFVLHSGPIRQEIFNGSDRDALVYLFYQSRNIILKDSKLLGKLAELVQLDALHNDNPYKPAVAILLLKLNSPEKPAHGDLQVLLANSLIESKFPIPSLIQVIMNVNSIDLYREKKHQGIISEQGVIDAFKSLHELSAKSADALYFTHYFARARDLQVLWHEKIPTLFEKVSNSFSNSMRELLDRSYNFAKLEHLCDPDFVTSAVEKEQIFQMIHELKSQLQMSKNFY